MRSHSYQYFQDFSAPLSGHRLPLQTGSYVLDDNYQPAHNSLESLIETWKNAAASQDLEVFKKAIALNQIERRSKFEIAEEWRTRLETTLAEGWTDKGQTDG